MCREMEIFYNEGREDGAERAKREIAIHLVDMYLNSKGWPETNLESSTYG